METQEQIRLIQQQIDEIDNLKSLNHRDPKFKKWKKRTELYLRHICGEDSHHFKDFERLDFHVLRIRLAGEPKIDQEDIRRYEEHLEEARIILNNTIEERKLFRVQKSKESNEERRIGFT